MVISLSEFQELSQKEKKKMFPGLKTELGIKGITREWGVSRSKLYNMLHEWNIPMETKKPGRPKNKKQEEPVGVTTDIYHEIPNESATYITGGVDKRSGFSEPTFTFDDDESRFSMHLDTQGPGSLLSETLQMFLKSDKFSNTSFHLHVTLKQI